MATINLMDKCAPKLDERFKSGSITDAWCGHDYEWEGVNAIKVYTLDAAELNDYNPTASANRFGTPSEVDDEVNVYALTKKRSFTKTFDITHVQDQMFLKRGVAYLKQMWAERYVPEIDTYRFSVWANGAGLGKVNSTALTKTSIVEAILEAHAALDNAFVPFENRVTFVEGTTAIKYRLAAEFGGDGARDLITKRQIGEINGSPIIAVPASRLPAGLKFMVKYKGASADPNKMKLLRANDNAPGIAGTLMEGLARYDSFVLAQKADGIYAYFESGACAAPTISVSGGSATMTPVTSGSTIKYTLDGTNPKTSDTAQVYSSAVPVSAGAKIRAYAYKTGLVNSAISGANA